MPLRLIVWCLDCRHQAEPDPAEMAERYGAEMTAPDWHARLVCCECGSRSVHMLFTGEWRHSRSRNGFGKRRGIPVLAAAVPRSTRACPPCKARGPSELIRRA